MKSSATLDTGDVFEQEETKTIDPKEQEALDKIKKEQEKREAQLKLDMNFVALIKADPIDIEQIKLLIAEGANPNCGLFGTDEEIEVTTLKTRERGLPTGSCAIHYLIQQKRYEDLELFLTIKGIFISNPYSQEDQRTRVLAHDELKSSIIGYEENNQIYGLELAKVENKLRGGRPLDYALSEGDPRAVFILVKAGADIDSLRQEARKYVTTLEGNGERQYSSAITDFFLRCCVHPTTSEGEMYKTLAMKEIIEHTTLVDLRNDLDFLLLNFSELSPEDKLKPEYSRFESYTSMERKEQTFKFVFPIAKEIFPNSLQEQQRKAEALGWEEARSRTSSGRRFSLPSRGSVASLIGLFEGNKGGISASAHTQHTTEDHHEETRRSDRASSFTGFKSHFSGLFRSPHGKAKTELAASTQVQMPALDLPPPSSITLHTGNKSASLLKPNQLEGDKEEGNREGRL